MFPDGGASETSDVEGGRSAISQKPTRSPYFLQSLTNNLNKEDNAAGISRFQYYSKLKNFIKREDTLAVSVFNLKK